jgi:ubiquinone/menaquinone biosynthesis C-methylase UbiE
MKTEKIRIFEENWKSYDAWYDKYPDVFQSELRLLRRVIPSRGLGLDIGIGTGRFASPLSIKFGLDPAYNMLKLAQKRDVVVVQGVGEALPFKNESFHFVSIVVTISFTENPLQVLREAYRILKKEGALILATIDKDSDWGKFYKAKRSRSRFFQTARFSRAQDILSMLENFPGKNTEVYQTLFRPLPDIRGIEEARLGFGQGGFVVFKRIKE